MRAEAGADNRGSLSAIVKEFVEIRSVISRDSIQNQYPRCGEDGICRPAIVSSQIRGSRYQISRYRDRDRRRRPHGVSGLRSGNYKVQ